MSSHISNSLEDMGIDFYRLMTEDFPAVRAKYLEYGAEAVQQLVDPIGQAYCLFKEIDSTAQISDRHAYVSAFAHLTVTNFASSVQLFMSGYLLPGGNMLRHSVESVCLASLCSRSDLQYLSLWAEGKYSSNKAPKHARKHSKLIGVSKDTCEKLVQVQGFYSVRCQLSETHSA